MKRYISILWVIVAITFVQIGQAGTITKIFNFSESDLTFDRYNDYVIVNLSGYGHTQEVGSPHLPMALYNILVPASAEVVSITIENSESVEIPGVFDVMPTPEFQPLSLTSGPIINPNLDIYSQTTAYPGRLVNYSSTGSKSGYRLCGFSLYPVQYVPSEKRLIFYKNITVKINYEEGKIIPATLTRLQKNVFEKEIRSIVINPEDISIFAPAEHRLQNEVSYLLITTDAFVSNFQPLVNWRTKQGFKGEIITVNTISSTYSGRDIQEKMRNAIIYYFQNRGLIYVVLAGDNQIVQPRIARVISQGYTGDIPCDLYFSDLNGTWDANNNNIFGEVPGDNVDMNPDVYVGRASIDNTTEANTFVNKIFTYEKNPQTDYLKKILLPSVMLFSQYNYHGRVVNDTIANVTPLGWIDRHLIDPPSTTPMRDSLNNGFHFCHASAHGNEVGLYHQSGGAIYTNTEASSQTNGNKLFIMNAIACNTGDFGYGPSDCLAEMMMNNPNGGAVAAIMNSRYGWGQPPQLGPSELMDVRFYDFLLNRDSVRIGVAHARSKSMYTSQGQSQSVWRWCIYELNLFGDPAMPMWTDVPQNITAQFPQVVPLGPSNFTIQVYRNLSVPIGNAFVSVQKGTEVYAQGYTDATGVVTIPITPITPGKFYITVTVHNCYPYQDSAMVQSNGAYVTYLRATMVDSARGNGDGIPNPGEAINMRTWVKNWGNVLAGNVTGKLRTTDVFATITDSVKTFGNIPALDSAYSGSDGFDFEVAQSCTNAQRIRFQLYCKDALDSSWTSNIFVRVGAPVLIYRSKTVYDPAPANNNGRLDPGETADLIVILRNQGYGNGYNVTGTLRSYDNRLIVLDSLGTFGAVMHETTGTNQIDRFTLQAESQISPGTSITCSLRICADANPARTIGFNLIVGEFRIIDPIPDGPRIPARYWAYDNVDSIYTERPVYNWIEIKNIGTRLLYDHNDQVRKVPLPANFVLRFYGQRYDTISVSVDGFIRLGADTTRDYSNSGLPDPDGPAPMIAANWDDLVHLNTGNGGVWWYHNQTNGTFIIEWDSLSYYQATSTRDKFQVIFYDSTFVTPTGDNTIVVQYMTANRTSSSTVGIEDPTETIGIQYVFDGMYHPAAAGIVAGRAIKYSTSEPITGLEEKMTINIAKRSILYTNHPNPFKDHTFISYNINQRGRVELEIYDATGRIVRTLLNNVQETGSYTLRWDSKDNNGKKVAQGIYFCQLKTDKNTTIKKLAIVK